MKHSHLIWLGLTFAIFLWGFSGDVGGTGLSSPDPKNLRKGKVVQEPSCDFDIVVSESDFCVIDGRVRDVDIALVLVKGICEGSATVRVKGLPEGATGKILPSSKAKFANGVARATVRIDTAKMNIKEIATSTLTFSASKEEVIRTANANMTVDLPSFDFSIEPHPSRLRVYEGDDYVATTTLKVRLLGASCESVKRVVLSLDSSLPKTKIIDHLFSSDFVQPPGEAIISFKTSPSFDDEVFLKAVVMACCTGDGLEKTAEIALNVRYERIPEEEGELPDEIDGTFRIDSEENILKMLKLPKKMMEQDRKNYNDLTTKGYVESTEEMVQQLKHSIPLVRPMDQIRGLLTFEPVSLKNTPFERFQIRGGYPDGGPDEDGKSIIVVRVFTMPNGAIVQLTENDLFTSGGFSLYSQERINENVNGFPAILAVAQSPSGHALTVMEWTTTTTDYTLQMEGNVKKNGLYGLFLDLAKSITEKSTGMENRMEETEEKSPEITP